MRLYIGDRPNGGIPRVVVVERNAGPEPLNGWTTPVFLEPWGDRGAGSLDLADSILRDVLREWPSLAAAERFRDEVIARFPRAGFRISDSEVSAWHAAVLEQSPPAMMPAAAPVTLAENRPQATASALVSACEAAWAAIQAAHPDVPDAVIVLGTGVERGKLVKLGHWWGGRWLADGSVRGEVLLAGEALHLPATEVFEVLLHEAAHGLNAARGIRDASRGGRYHNQQFRGAAATLGLRVEKMPPHGWARTSLTVSAAEQYAEPIAALAQAMRISRQLDVGTAVGAGGEQEQESTGDAERVGRTRNGIGATCGCGRRLRIAPSVYAQGPVICGVCGAEFTTDRSLARSMERRGLAVVDDSFMERRKQALASGVGTTPTASESTEGPSWGEDHRRLTGPARPAALNSTGAGLHDVLHKGMLESWREVWGTADEVLLCGSSDTEIHELNQLARRTLKRDGMLHGPALVAGGLEFMAGDRVVVGPDGLDWPAGGPAVPQGVVGTVEAVGPGWLEIDFAIVGRNRFPASTIGTRSLRHGYAVHEADVAGDIDVRSLRMPLPNQGVAATVEAGLSFGADMEP
jgi:hypothetical protein